MLDGLAFALLPAPTGTDLLAILDRVIRRIARRIADETGDYDAAGDPDPCPDLFAQIQAEAATTWRSPATATSDVMRGTDRLRAWSEGFSLHAGVVIADHDASKDITFALPAPAVHLAPVDTATSVNTTTAFSWTGTPMTVYGLDIVSTLRIGDPSAEARYIVYTIDTMATIPVVPELMLPRNQSFAWWVSGYSPTASIDDAATMVGLETVSSVDFDGGRHSYTNSTVRTFTSAP